MIFLLKLSCCLPCFVPIGFLGIDQYHKRLAYALKLLNRLLFCRPVIASWYVCYAPVCGNNNSDSRMIMDHLSGSDSGCPGKRDFMVKPRRFHQPFFPAFDMAGSSLYHISHTVDQTDAYGNILRQPDLSRILRHKFRFCCHNRPSGCRLRQLISCPLLPMLLLHLRKHKKLHEPLDKRGFSCPHRPHHTYVDLSASPGLYILIQLICVHTNTPLLYL